MTCVRTEYLDIPSNIRPTVLKAKRFICYKINMITLSVNNTQQNETLPKATHENSCMEWQYALSHVPLGFTLRDEALYHKEATEVMQVIGWVAVVNCFYLSYRDRDVWPVWTVSHLRIQPQTPLGKVASYCSKAKLHNGLNWIGQLCSAWLNLHWVNAVDLHLLNSQIYKYIL